MLLDDLAKKDNYWRDIAYRICGDRNEADDLVQEMYLRRYSNDRGQRLTDSYIIQTIKSIFLNRIKTNKYLPVETIFEKANQEQSFEPNDVDQFFLDRIDKLSYTERELVELSYDYSLRDIQKMMGINYGFVYKKVKGARETVLNGYSHKYNNKRLKNKKMSNAIKLEDYSYKELRKLYPDVYDKSLEGLIKKIKEQVERDSFTGSSADVTDKEVVTTEGVADAPELAIRGLGDVVEKVLEKTKISKLIKVVVKDGCGCEERKKALNELFKFKLKPKCLDEDELKEYGEFMGSRAVKIDSNGEVGGVLNKHDIDYVCGFYKIVFNTTDWKPNCYSCIGTRNQLVKMIIELDTVYFNNIKK